MSKYSDDLLNLNAYFVGAKTTTNIKALQSVYMEKFTAKNLKAFQDYVSSTGNVLKSNKKAVTDVTKVFMDNAKAYETVKDQSRSMYMDLVKSEAEMNRLGIPNVRVQEKMHIIDDLNKEVDKLQTENKTLGDRLKEALKFKGMYTNLVSNLTVKENMSQDKIEKYSQEPAQAQKVSNAKSKDTKIDL